MKRISTMHTMKRESGAVSIFVVIFAALLLSVLTVGFVRLMIADQQRATNNDLSQSAYDSAMTGVEDVKRAIINYQNVCRTGTVAACSDLRARITKQDVCNAVVREENIITDSATSPDDEVLIQQSSGDAALGQAYTCVTLGLDTPDYIGEVAQNESKLIPLNGVTPFTSITVEWFTSKDAAGATAINVPAEKGGIAQPMLDQGSWPSDRPPVLRTGLMQVGSSFTLADFDAMKGDASNANTLFLYPTQSGNKNSSFKDRDPRASLDAKAPAIASSAPLQTNCSTSVTGDEGSYACSITLDVPAPIDGGTRTAYLRLTSLYNATHFRITLNGTDFRDVQALVDSTGRANNLFRRVQSRIDLLDTTFQYPDAALDLGGNLCKDFAVTAEGSSGAVCDPSKP
jgi:hypothetical protein